MGRQNLMKHCLLLQISAFDLQSAWMTHSFLVFSEVYSIRVVLMELAMNKDDRSLLEKLMSFWSQIIEAG